MSLDGNHLYEFSTHAFVIKIWLEDGFRWRGHITHVPSGERRYIDEMGEINDFIFPYLEKMGIQRSTVEQLYSLLRLKRSQRRLKGASKQDQENSSGEQA